MTVIRDAIIRLKLEQQRTSDNSSIDRAFQAQAKSGKEAERSTREVERATKDLTKAAKEAAPATDAWAAGIRKVNQAWKEGGSGRDAWSEGLKRMKEQRDATRATEIASQDAEKAARELARTTGASTESIVKNFREGGEGAFRMARGIALLSASGSQDLQRLIQTVAVAQGAFDVFAGGFKMFTGLGKIFGGPVAAGIGLATAAITAGIAIWNRWENAAKEAAKAAEEVRKQVIENERVQAETWAAQQQREAETRSGQLGISRLRAQFAITPDDRTQALLNEESQLQKQMRQAEQRRNQRLRGFQPEVFGGDASEAFGNLLKFGSKSDLSNALDFERTRQEVSRRQLEIDKEQYDADRKRLSERNAIEAGFFSAGQQAAGALGGGLFGAGAQGVGAVGQSAASEAQRQMDQLISAQRQANQALIEAFDEAREKITALKDELAIANPN